MTYEEIKQKLAVCEKALNSIKNGGYKNISEKTLNKITTIKEGLTKLMKEQEDTSPGIVQTDDESKAEKLAQKGISVQLTNEDKGIQFDQNQTALIARSVGKALGRALIDGGSELESMRGTRIRPNSFDIHVIFKDNNEDDFSFYIQDDKLHLQDINLDKILVDIGTKPDGSGLVNKDVLKNEFQKHFKSLNEYDRDADWSDEEQYDFEIGDEVELRGPYEENPGEVFTISHTGSRGQFWIADERGRGWYVYPSQIKPAEEAVYENKAPRDEKNRIIVPDDVWEKGDYYNDDWYQQKFAWITSQEEQDLINDLIKKHGPQVVDKLSNNHEKLKAVVQKHLEDRKGVEYWPTSELAGYTRRGTKELEVEPSKFKGRDKSTLRGLKEGDLVYLDDGDIDFLKSFVARMGHDKDPVKGEEFTKLKQILQSIIRSQEEDTLTLQEGTELWDDDKFTFKRFSMGKEGMGLQITTRAGKYIVLKGDDVKQFARAAVHVAQEFENLDHQVPINESPSVAKLQKRHSEIVSKMKELAKEYKKGDHSVVDKLKELNSEKKQIVDLLDQSVSNIGRGQQLAEFVGGELEKRSDAYFEKLVPGSGSAGTVEGEMLRAINRIIYRWYNDGDWFFRGYGVETAAPAMAFLRDSNEIPHDIRVNLNRLEDEAVQNDGNEKEYERILNVMLEIILNYIDSKKGKYTKSKVDMWDFPSNYEKDDWDDEDDYDDYYGDEYEDEEDYMQEEKEVEYYPETFIDIATSYMKKRYDGRKLGTMGDRQLERLGQKIVDTKYDGDARLAYEELVDDKHLKIREGLTEGWDWFKKQATKLKNFSQKMRLATDLLFGQLTGTFTIHKKTSNPNDWMIHWNVDSKFGGKVEAKSNPEPFPETVQRLLDIDPEALKKAAEEAAKKHPPKPKPTDQATKDAFDKVDYDKQPELKDEGKYKSDAQRKAIYAAKAEKKKK